MTTKATKKNEIAAFTKTEKDLKKFKKDFAIIPKTDTEDGYAFVKSACTTLKDARLSVEAARRDAKQPYLDAGKAIDSKAKEISAQIVLLEDPMKAAKKIQDDKEAIAKAKRIADLKKKVNAIALHVDDAKGRSSAEILEVIEKVKAIETAEGFYDLTTEATQCRAETLETLEDMYSSQFSFEDQEAQRIKAEEETAKLLRAQTITDRINKLQQIPLAMLGENSIEIQSKIDSVKKHEPAPEDFDDRYNEATTACKAVLGQLDQMLVMAKMAEQQQVQQQPEPDPLQEPEYKEMVEVGVVKSEAVAVNYEEEASTYLDRFDPATYDTNIKDDGAYLAHKEPELESAIWGDVRSWAENCDLDKKDYDALIITLKKYIV